MRKTVPTPIVDKNGRQTTVHKSADDKPVKNRLLKIVPFGATRREKAVNTAQANRILVTALENLKEVRADIRIGGLRGAREKLITMPDAKLNALVGLAAIITLDLQKNRDDLPWGIKDSGERISAMTVRELHEVSVIRESEGWEAAERYVADMPRPKRESLTLVASLITKTEQLHLPRHL